MRKPSPISISSPRQIDHLAPRGERGERSGARAAALLFTASPASAPVSSASSAAEVGRGASRARPRRGRTRGSSSRRRRRAPRLERRRPPAARGRGSCGRSRRSRSAPAAGWAGARAARRPVPAAVPAEPRLAGGAGLGQRRPDRRDGGGTAVPGDRVLRAWPSRASTEGSWRSGLAAMGAIVRGGSEPSCAPTAVRPRGRPPRAGAAGCPRSRLPPLAAIALVLARGARRPGAGSSPTGCGR